MAGMHSPMMRATATHFSVTSHSFGLPDAAPQSKGVLPWSFGGNCGPLGGHLAVDKISGNTPADVLKLIPQDTCLPRGWLYKMPNLADAGFSPRCGGV